MSDQLVTAIFFLMCVGQVAACRKGRLPAVCYYLATVFCGHFTFWYGFTWTLDRACAVVLISAWMMVWKRQPHEPSFIASKLWIVLAYGIVLTVIRSPSWPQGVMDSANSVYSSLRWAVQILNWILMIVTAWIIGTTITSQERLTRVVKPVLLIAAMLCTYALYQQVAFRTGLPMTGIRRPIDGQMGSVTSEGYGMFAIQGTVVYRSNSLVGEPKGLGGACVIWMALLLAEWNSFGRRRRVSYAVLIAAALWFSTSTSAWVAAILLLCLTPILKGTDNLGWRNAMLAITGGVLAVFVYTTIGVVGSGTEGIVGGIVQSRLADRLGGDAAVSDLAEKASIEVLRDNPSFVLLGTGLGGMSFYIAERMTEVQRLILFPNNGLLGIVCNIGILGLGVIISVASTAILSLRRPHCDAYRRKLCFVGLGVFLQCMIFNVPLFFSIALGFLTAGAARSNRPLASRPRTWGVAGRRFSAESIRSSGACDGVLAAPSHHA